MRVAGVGPLVVLKVGGSLLDWPALPGRLARELVARRGRDERPVLIAGGGRAADLVRDLDRTHALGEERSHALAIRSMDLTAHFLVQLVGHLTVVEELASIEAAWKLGVTPVLAPRRFLDEEDRSARPLAHSWSVTSDSIAARLAVRLGAIELALLKSAALPEGTGRNGAARLGLVDPAFPDEARELPRVTYCNFRSETLRFLELMPS